MAYPNLYNDESIVLNAQNVKVKSVSFEAVLTTRRLILVDSKKHLIAPQEILLATIRDIETGENAIRDSTISLSIITATGATRQMILTFSKTSGGDRRRERDEWVKILRQNISSSVQHPIMPDPQPPVGSSDHTAETRHAPANIEAANIPAASSQKKKIEIARPGPIKKIVETAPAMPQPVETSTLPTGSFCNRCGSRVPEGSAFCNKCGTPVVTESDIEAHLAAAAAPQAAPASAVPQVQMTTPPQFGAGAANKDRPIEDVIHSIEPLIEDSVPRTKPYPLVPKQQWQPQTAAAPEQPPVAGPAEVPAQATGTAAPEATPAPAKPAMPEVKWPVLGSAALPPETPAAAPEPAAAPPVPPAPSRGKKGLVVGIIAIVLIAIVAAVFIFANPLGGGTAAPATTPTPAVTAIATTVPVTTRTTTPATVTVPETAATSSAAESLVPASGVWVHVIYASEFKGSVGTAGNQGEVSDKGERFYQVPTSEGIVVASIQKLDGSSERLTVKVYKDGELITEKSSVTPKGVVEVMANLKPSPTPTPTPTPTKIPVPVKNATESVNTTANGSVTTTAS